MSGDFVKPVMTTGTRPKRQLLWLGLMVLVVLSGLCAIFVSVVTAAQAWQEHAQARWPEATARVDTCALRQTSTGRRQGYYIDCRLSYAVDAEQNVATVYSSSVPSRNIWQYPPNQIGPFEEWVAEHPPGAPIMVRYDPANHLKVVLVGNYMPRGGPRTPSNIKQLEFWAGSFLVLLTIALVARPRSA